MDDEQQEIWFYSRGGEKCGPVSFADLQAKAKEAALNPRLDLVWTQGMAEWTPAGEIDGLFERPSALQPTASPVAADPYQSPAAEAVAEKMAHQGDWPGARRRSYLIVTWIVPILWSLGISAAAGFLAAQLGPEIMKFALPALGLLPLVLVVFISLARLVNLGMSRWWFLGNFVPFLNLWVGYRCFACPAGYAYHQKLDVAGILLAIIYWLLWLVVLVAVAAIIAIFTGAWGTPEDQQLLQDIIRTASTPKP